MTLRCVSTVLLLLILHDDWTQQTGCGVEATSVPVGCVCVRELKFIRWRVISDLSIMAESPVCRKHIIVKLKGGREVCLKPDTDQGKMLQRCWKKVKNRDRKKRCLRPAKQSGTKSR